MIKTHRFRGVVYDVHIGACDGACDPPERVADPSLYINMEPSDTLKFLETAIHESLHACHFSCDEERITETARDVARLLRRLGYRLK